MIEHEQIRLSLWPFFYNPDNRVWHIRRQHTDGSQQAESNELVRGLLSEGIPGDNHQDRLASIGRQRRQHRFRLAGTRRHDDGRWCALQAPVSPNGMQGA
ncbi:hypothetical protein D3C85_1261890 [compost metagenome]